MKKVLKISLQSIVALVCFYLIGGAFIDETGIAITGLVAVTILGFAITVAVLALFVLVYAIYDAIHEKLDE